MKSERYNHLATFYRDTPEKIILPAASSALNTNSLLPPVRIFLGSEDAQYRAERVFVYSIEKVRNPERQYEIYIMKNLRGFDRSQWRTGFTMYRYAIPALAGGEGKAIYNDVDQIYLTDPAELFDINMHDYGYMSVSENDTSVMLINCKSMLPYWNSDTASTRSKSDLNNVAAQASGLWGVIEPYWNVRDQEYPADKAKLIHFTALHLQPWQPTPESYSYHPNPYAYLWQGLEWEASNKQYQLFTINSPSRAYLQLQDLYKAEAKSYEYTTRSKLENGTAYLHFGGTFANTDSDLTIDLVADTEAIKSLSVEKTEICCLLERVPQDDIPWILSEVFKTTRSLVIIIIDYTEKEIKLSDGHSKLRTKQSSSWWKSQVIEASKNYPSVKWKLSIHAKDDKSRTVSTHFESPTEIPNKVLWFLEGERKGDNDQLHVLANNLPYSSDRKKLEFNQFNSFFCILKIKTLLGLDIKARSLISSPWPDYVLSAGRRSVPVARWIKKASGGKTLLIHVGRPWCSISGFDLVITTPQYQLPIAKNVICNSLSLNELNTAEIKDIPSSLQTELFRAPSPYITVVLGGDSRPYKLTQDTVVKMADSINKLATTYDSSILICTSPRTPKGLANILTAKLNRRYILQEWDPKRQENYYPIFIALADRVVITGDSVSMVSEISKIKDKLYIQKLPKKFDLRLSLVRILRRFTTHKTSTSSYRGTPKQQGWLSRQYDSLISNGWITSVRDLDLFFDQLHEAKRIRYLGESEDFNSTENDIANIELSTTIDYIVRHSSIMAKTN